MEERDTHGGNDNPTQRLAQLQQWKSDPEKIEQRTRKQRISHTPTNEQERERLAEHLRKYQAEHPHWKENIRQKNLGKKYNQETRAKVSAASKALWQSQEHRAKMKAIYEAKRNKGPFQQLGLWIDEE